MIHLRWTAVAALCFALVSCGHNADKARQIALQRGQRFYQEGRYADAEIQFRKALQEDKQSGEAYLWLGRSAKQQGNYAAAAEGFRQAMALTPGQDAARIELLNLLLLAYLGDPGKPPELYRQLTQLSQEMLTQNSDSQGGIRVQGYLAMIDGKYAQAVEYFRNAIRLKPDEADVVTALVESLLLDGKAEEAEEVAHDFLRRKPTCGPVYTVLYHYYMGAGRTAEGEAILKSQIAANPKGSFYRIQLAQHYTGIGKTQEASQTLDQLLGNLKDFPGAYLDVGDFYADNRNWAEARKQYELGMLRDPKSKLQYSKRLVRIYLGMNDRPAAQRQLEETLKAEPHDREARASQAALWMSSDDPQHKKLAGDELKALVEEFPENLDYRLHYAEAMRLTGQTEAARSQYLLLAQRQPRNALVLQELADLSLREQRTDEAMSYADRVLSLDPHSVRALLVRSAALATKGRFSETRTILIGLTQEHPDLREAQLQLALLDVEQKRYPAAEKRFRAYYEQGRSDVRVLEGLVELYRAQNQMDRAIALVQADLEKRPQANEIRALLANTAAQAGQTNLAIQEYERLVQFQPNSSEFAVRLGLACQARHDLPRAIAEFERAGKLAPQSPLAYAYLAKALDEAGRKAEAVQKYRQSLSLDNHNPWALNNLAYLLAETGGNLDEALKLAQLASQQDPNNPAFTDTVGWVYLKQRKFDSAAHVFESVCDKNPKDFTLRMHLATALLEAGELHRAKLELQTAQRLAATEEDRESIQKLLTRLENR